MTDQEAFDVLEGAIGMIEGEWGEGDGSEGSALSHIRARLTTAETERDYQQAQADEWRDRAFAAKDVLKTANDNCERLDGERAAAEARVEALSEALRAISNLSHQHSETELWQTHCPRCIARAALACPPRLGFNPEPLKVVERRDDVAGVDAIRGRSREDRLRVWLALGGTEDNFPVAACPPQQRGE